MNQTKLRWALAAILSVAGSSAMAQFAVQRVQGISASRAAVVSGSSGEAVVISLGDTVKRQGRDPILLDTQEALDNTLLNDRETVTITKKDGSTVTGQVRPSKDLIVGIYWSGFSVSGPIQQPNSTFRGGTRTVYGSLLSAEKPVAFYSGDRSLSVGGWWFKPDKGDPGADLYQAHVRYHFNPSLSAQVAYIDSTKVTARSASFHLIFRAGSQATQPNARTPWAIDIGLGVLTNFTNDTNSTTGVVTSRRSTNFSTFTTVSFQLKDRIGVTGTTWFVRDRNVDFLRFGVGLTLKF